MKRRKFGIQGKTEISREVIKRLLKWWPALLCLPAAALLVFEAYRLGVKPNPLTKASEMTVTQKKPLQHLDKKLPGNLNRLDPITRAVGGSRERELPIKVSIFKSDFSC